MFDFLAQKFGTVFSSFSKNSEIDSKSASKVLSQIEEALLSADVPYELAQTFCESISKELVGIKRISSLKPAEQLTKIVYDKMVTFLGEEQALFAPKNGATVMVMGLQGSGKTTTISKLGHYLLKKDNRQKILVGSVDFYRPAAVEQLKRMAQRAKLDFYEASSNDPVVAAQEIQTYAHKNKYDVLFLDTAGRLHIDNQMLAELQTIATNLQPAHKLLVLDAMTGQESLAVARAFDQSIGFQGVVLSKTDSDSRGGAAFSFRYALKKPILFVGRGEKVADLDQFYPERAASRMLGMGDMKSLAERADEAIAKQEQQQMYNSWDKGELSLDDFAQQMDMVNRLGSLSSLMKYMPGMGNMKLPDGALEQGQVEMARFRAIISSMTPKERSYPKLLNGSRKARVARGAGVQPSEVDKLLSRFVNMQQYAKLIRKSGGLSNIFK